MQHTDVYLSKQLELPQLDSLYSKKDDLHFDSNNQIRRKLSIFHLVHIDPNIQRQLISMILNNENFIPKKDLSLWKIYTFFRVMSPMCNNVRNVQLFLGSLGVAHWGTTGVIDSLVKYL